VIAHQHPSDGFTLSAASLDPKGKLTELDAKTCLTSLKNPAFTTWIHIRVESAEKARKFLEEDLNFHPLAVEDALSENERPTVQEHNGVVFLGAAAVEDIGIGEEFIEVGFFLMPHALVTVVNRPAPAFEEWFDRWCRNAQWFGNHPAFMLHALLDAIVDAYFPAVDRLEDEVEALADSVYEGRAAAMQEALALKRRLLELRRHIAPTRDVINSLLRRDFTFVPPESKVYFQDVYDHTLRIADTVDLNRDTLASVIDAQLALASNNLNLIMRKLTVYATILMSMGLIAGIYGMNFKYMPELDWRLGYPLSLAAMAGIGMVEWYFFKLKKWL
jgi:magnesium transporter